VPLRKKSDSTDGNLRFNRPEIRCSCPSRMKINLIDGSYFVYEFESEHNHILATPEQRHQLRSQRKFDEAQISRIEVAKSVGISTKAAVDLLAKKVGGIENLGFTHVDVKNRLYTKRSLMVHKGDTSGVLEYMERRSSEDAKFFYSIQVDEDDLITNIFWADSKMVADYEAFGDVVGFDTTYRKLDDGRPLGLIVGVNNHKKITIFGAALLYNETT
jgi:zinc finger SWIM domain-containing protein 3